MNMIRRKGARSELLEIPGVGPKTVEDLNLLGIITLDELKGKDPEELYTRLCNLMGSNIDRCMLYVFRCAVYYVSTDIHDKDLLQWWRWKD